MLAELVFEVLLCVAEALLEGLFEALSSDSGDDRRER
jgi:hypothetical protein